MKRKNLIFIFCTLILIVIAGCSSNKKSDVNNNNMKEITIFKSSSCGCCDIYSSYIKGQGFNTEIITVQDIGNIKDSNKIPLELRSCHTSIIGNYFVEGHVPAEAINKLISEQPQIKGIGMAGMPSGSPGMHGSKNDKFTIYQVGIDGSMSEFMTI